jgi:hypothetical protein
LNSIILKAFHRTLRQLLALQDRRRSEEDKERTEDLLVAPANDDAANPFWLRFVKCGNWLNARLAFAARPSSLRLIGRSLTKSNARASGMISWNKNDARSFKRVLNST